MAWSKAKKSTLEFDNEEKELNPLVVNLHNSDTCKLSQCLEEFQTNMQDLPARNQHKAQECE